MSESGDIAQLSNLLDNCESFNHKTFNELLSNNTTIKNNPSALFNNIDGNKSNFDSFVSDISQYSHLFSFIGISETNVDECHKGLYAIPGYNSEYGTKISGKNKGSGTALCLYIHESYTFTRLEKWTKTIKISWKVFLFK